MNDDGPRKFFSNFRGPFHFFVILSRFELLTSCLSSKRSKPTELKDRDIVFVK